MRHITNPIVAGWYADPESRIYGGRYWIYATRSRTDYQEQLNLDAFCSTDLMHWEKREGIVEVADFPWVWRAVWAPTILEHEGRYYLIFASNDLQNVAEIGGLKIAVSDSPGGPFRGYLGRPLIDRFVLGAQPIDAHLFKADDGTVYLYYGGWRHCNVARMNADMTGFAPFENGETFLGITPPGYVEAPCVLGRAGLYYLMWSEGDWVDGTYGAAYGVGGSPLGPFGREGFILSSQPPLAGVPVRFGNDANLFALGEWWGGAARGTSRVIGVTLGTGLGAGFVAEGEIVTSGPDVPPDGELWHTPDQGGVAEDFASGRAVTRAYAARSGQTVGAAEVAARADTGDPGARGLRRTRRSSRASSRRGPRAFSRTAWWSAGTWRGRGRIVLPH